MMVGRRWGWLMDRDVESRAEIQNRKTLRGT